MYLYRKNEILYTQRKCTKDVCMYVCVYIGCHFN